MPKGKITKSKLCITLDIGLVKILDKECGERTMKMSNYIEKLINIGLKNEKRK